MRLHDTKLWDCTSRLCRLHVHLQAATHGMHVFHACAVQLYIAGHWSAARGAFEDLITSRTRPDGSSFEDPPSRTLMDFMASHNYVAPQGWAGVRELTEK